MITKDNLRQTLISIGFVEDGQSLSKTYAVSECTINIDFKNGEIKYPENKGFTINEKQTCNFSENENFVVLECVDSLLSKGYEPKHIELEPRWKLGHEAKSGRADIWVRTFKKENDIETDEKESLLIIECKTAGSEFNGAWKDTMDDGAQLFSYFQQEQATKFLCLYTSDFVDDSVNREYHLINVQDNKELIDTLKEPKTYKDSKNNKQLFATWKETYQQDSSTRGLFETDIAAYHIGKNKYSVADLREIDNDSMQKKYNEFATILRQHNVSGHENAFDKLVNLFLAKVVDETNNPKELAFYWKGAAYDDFFRLQDRLQKLYKDGMGKFLGEDVTYIDNSDIDNAFRLFKNDPDATKETILKYFRELKFFTNNDFAFIDVHNEHLFYQNSAVLLKMVKMLQDIKLKTETQNQFLGDLFEGFLDQGVKQSEGQFFTPTPIVKFLVSSLPLQQMIEKSSEIPQVIDYACGAGHFLNEYAEQIKPFVENKKGNLHDFYSAITGIEKEYRLSKVSKVASFMYGQDEINIIYADALSDIKEVKDDTFSVLIANPPYSVKGFLETLNENDRAKFELTKEVGDVSRNNSIETFFVERASQLLKAGGIAAIILPSSILTNGNIYIKCREIILKYFDIVAITEFGSGTFGKTGTNTVTLFLRRKQTIPSLSEHYSNRVKSWFSGDESKDEVFDDNELLELYCKYINVPLNVYKQLFTNTLAIKKTELKNKLYDDEVTLMAAEEQAEYHVRTLYDYDIFKEYRQAFGNDTVAKSIKKKRITTKYTEDDRQLELEKHISDSIRDIEKEKLYYFMLAESNPHPVVVVKSPADNKGNKQFLGYEWSSSKGNEGIKYIGASISDDENDLARNKGISAIKTPLFNPNDLADSEKINSIIRRIFMNEDLQIPENLTPFVSAYRLVDMLDFSRVTFDKQIKTTASRKVEIKSKYPLVKLGEIIEFGNFRQLQANELELLKSEIGTVKLLPSSNNYDWWTTEELAGNNVCEGEVVCLGVARYANTKYYKGKFISSNNKILVSNGNDKALMAYWRIFVELYSKNFYKTSTQYPQFDTEFFNSFTIPLPSLDIQSQIVAECEKVDAAYEQGQQTIEECKKKIRNVLSTITGVTHQRLEQILVPVNGNTTKIQENRILDKGKYPVITQETGRIISGYSNEEPITDVPLIIFGDHSCSFKYVDFAFIRGADGTQLIKTNKSYVIPKFLYYYLKNIEIENFGKYQRHFKWLKQVVIKLPSITDQQRIVEEIDGYETQIALAKTSMSGCAEKKKEILRKYL